MPYKLTDVYKNSLLSVILLFLKNKIIFTWIFNFSEPIFALTKFNNLLKCYQER